MTDTLIIKLPFSGFYESKWSGEVDNCEEQETEYYESDKQAEEGIPPELRLTASEYFDILFRHTEYGDAYRTIAEDYAPCFSTWFKGETDLDLGLTFESMTSPCEYNFATDRVFANIPVTAVRAMFERSAADSHERLAEVIKERFTSYDGFSSYYDNDLESWLAKDVLEWDHNEIETLLLACLPADSDDFEGSILEGMCEGIYTAWSNAVDWPKVEAEIEEVRAQKRAELDPAAPEPVYRCTLTPDLFKDGQS